MKRLCLMILTLSLGASQIQAQKKINFELSYSNSIYFDASEIGRGHAMRYFFPLGFSFGPSYKISDKIMLIGSFDFHYWRKYDDLNGIVTMLPLEEKYLIENKFILNVPIYLKCHLLSLKDFGFYSKFGIRNSFNWWRRRTAYIDSRSDVIEKGYAGYFLFSSAGLGLNYKISEKISIFIESNLEYDIIGYTRNYFEVSGEHLCLTSRLGIVF